MTRERDGGGRGERDRQQRETSEGDYLTADIHLSASQTERQSCVESYSSICMESKREWPSEHTAPPLA